MRRHRRAPRAPLASVAHDVPPERHRRDPPVPAAQRSEAQGRLSCPGAGLGRRRHDENVANGRPGLRAQDVAHDALDGTLHGGESIEWWALVEGRSPRGVEIRLEARKGFGDRSVDGDRLGQEVQVSHERIGSAWRRVARRAAVGTRGHLDREQPIGVDGSGLTFGGLDRSREPDARAVGRRGRSPAREVAGCAPRESSEPRGSGRWVGGQDRAAPRRRARPGTARAAAGYGRGETSCARVAAPGATRDRAPRWSPGARPRSAGLPVPPSSRATARRRSRRGWRRGGRPHR